MCANHAAIIADMSQKILRMGLQTNCETPQRHVDKQSGQNMAPTRTHNHQPPPLSLPTTAPQPSWSTGRTAPAPAAPDAATVLMEENEGWKRTTKRSVISLFISLFLLGWGGWHHFDCEIVPVPWFGWEGGVLHPSTDRHVPFSTSPVSRASHAALSTLHPHWNTMEDTPASASTNQIEAEASCNRKSERYSCGTIINLQSLAVACPIQQSALQRL